MKPDLTLLELVAMGLAGWRVAALLVFEEGPFNVFQRLRERLGIRHDDTGHPNAWPEGGLGRLLSCVWCVSFWTTLGVYAILWVESHIVMVLAAWGAATLLEAFRDRR